MEISFDISSYTSLLQGILGYLSFYQFERWIQKPEYIRDRCSTLCGHIISLLQEGLFRIVSKSYTSDLDSYNEEEIKKLMLKYSELQITCFAYYKRIKALKYFYKMLNILGLIFMITAVLFFINSIVIKIYLKEIVYISMTIIVIEVISVLLMALIVEWLNSYEDRIQKMR